MQALSDMRPSAWVDWLGGFVAGRPKLWKRLGRIESGYLFDRIERTAVDRPMYIAGLARAGSTLLLEILAGCPGTASHRYCDFPPLLTPYWWGWFMDRAARREQEPVERAHRDRLRVTAMSPEALEEPVWMSFFPDIHDPGVDQTLDAATQRPDFEDFYRKHVKKLLLVRKGRRYLAKGNYNATRLAYLLRLFPDARFVVPVREPAAHVGSLVKQHRLFCQVESEEPRVLNYMRRVGHFEFGLDRRPVNTGDAASLQATLDAWAADRDAEGYAHQWDAVYSLLARQIESDAALRKAVLVLRYEDLCRDPESELRRLFSHVGPHVELPGEARIAAWRDRISAPDYYGPQLTAEESAAVRDIAARTAERFGYS